MEDGQLSVCDGCEKEARAFRRFGKHVRPEVARMLEAGGTKVFREFCEECCKCIACGGIVEIEGDDVGVPRVSEVLPAFHSRCEGTPVVQRAVKKAMDRMVLILMGKREEEGEGG